MAFTFLTNGGCIFSFYQTHSKELNPPCLLFHLLQLPSVTQTKKNKANSKDLGETLIHPGTESCRVTSLTLKTSNWKEILISWNVLKKEVELLLF